MDAMILKPDPESESNPDGAPEPVEPGPGDESTTLVAPPGEVFAGVEQLTIVGAEPGAPIALVGAGSVEQVLCAQSA